MFDLEPSDTHRISAAIGWLELGSPPEARKELESLSAGARQHPDVLEVCWMVHSQEQDWAAALEVSRVLVQSSPERASGWLHQAYALRRVKDGGLKAAWDLLLPACERFPSEPTIPYNLSCYACQLGQLELARKWLIRAMEVGDKDRIRTMAMNDSDLRTLWPEISSL